MSLRSFSLGFLPVLILILAGAHGVHGQTSFQRLEGEYSITKGMPGDQVKPRLSIGSSGGYVVWQDNAVDGQGLGIQARRINANLSPELAKTFPVNQITAHDQENPDVLQLSDGSNFFVWQGGPLGQQNIYLRVLSSDDLFLHPQEIQVNTFAEGQQQDPKLAALSDGSVLVVWSSQEQDGSLKGVYAQRFSSTGEKMGAEFPINEFTAYNQRTASAIGLANDTFVVAWVSEQQRQLNSVDIIARRFHNEGSAASGEFLVNTSTNVCANPVLASNDDGGFVVAWSELKLSDLSQGWDIKARYFTQGGAPQSETFTVNTHLPGKQYGPQVTSLGPYQFFVWTTLGQDGSSEGVPGRFFYHKEPFSDEIPINTTTFNQQIFPALAGDGTGRYLAVWSSYIGGSTSFEVLGQRFSTQQDLDAPSAPFAVALDQESISVTWPELAGFDVQEFRLFIDEEANPVRVTGNEHTVSGLTPESVHTFRLGYQLQDGRISPLSESVTAKTWSADLNGDSLPDEWQRLNWGKEVNWPDPEEDTDGDGASNYHEFLAGTDPTDSASVLSLEIVETSEGRQVLWNTQPGFVYQLQASLDLSGWEDVGNPVFAPGTTQSFNVSDDDGYRYFRVIRLR